MMVKGILAMGLLGMLFSGTANAGDGKTEPLPAPPRHVLTILAVTDLEAAAAFYERALGWPRKVDTPVFVEFGLPDGPGLGVYQREGFAHNTNQAPATVPEGAITGTEIYLHCLDLEAAIQRMKDAGARELAPLAPRDWGDEAAYFADPEGNVLVLARPLTASIDDVDRGDLRATMELAVRLLAEERYEEFIRELAHPDQVAEILKREPIEELVHDFAGGKADRARAAIEHCLTLEPQMREDGTVAVFVIEHDTIELPSGPLEFGLLDGRWYILN